MGDYNSGHKTIRRHSLARGASTVHSPVGWNHESPNSEPVCFCLAVKGLGRVLGFSISSPTPVAGSNCAGSLSQRASHLSEATQHACMFSFSMPGVEA